MALKKKSKPTTRVVAYLRCSTVGQAEDGLSLQVQREQVEQYAALYGLTVVSWEQDASSGKSLDRRGLKRALEALDEGIADGLVVAKLDRLTRSVGDLGELIADRFGADNGPALLSVAEQIDTRTANGRMVLNILASVSQWEREKIVERTTEALALKKANGEKLGGHVPYGFKVGEDGVHLEEEPSEQQLLARARALRAEGLGLRRIAEVINGEGYRTRKATTFATTQIARMLGSHVTC